MLTEDWSLYDANHVVYRPKTFTPDELLTGYYRALKGGLLRPVHFQAPLGHNSMEELIYPMNFGFRHGVSRLARSVAESARDPSEARA